MITIVTDSTAYFTKKEAEALNIKIVPSSYSVNGQRYLESYSDCNGDFERLLKSNADIKTSQPNPSSFLSCFEEILRTGNDILCITISSRLSGTYSTAHIAAKQFGGRITVLDSLSTAGGLNLMAVRARELLMTGYPVKEVYNMLLDFRKSIVTAFSVDDMIPLRKSGRIGIVRMSVSTILNIKPILLCEDGAVVSDTIARGYGDIIKKLLQKINHSSKQVVINYIENSSLAFDIFTIVKKTYPDINVKLSKMGPVLGIHLGLGVISVSCI